MDIVENTILYHEYEDDEDIGYMFTVSDIVNEDVKNTILTDNKITNHVMNCSKCMSTGLSNCKEFRQLEGVYDKPI